MKYVLMAFFWVIELLDTRSSDPVLHARKKAALSAYLCVVGSFVMSYLLSTDFIVGIVGGAGFLQSFTGGINDLFAVGLTLAALFLWFVGVWNIWVYYRTYTRPELFLNDWELR